MKLIVGLGNPGSQYNFTRHNFGFLALDFYAKIHKLEFQNKPKFFADIAKDDENDLLLVKATTFYNEVGMCARAIMDFYKLKPQDFLAVCEVHQWDLARVPYSVPTLRVAGIVLCLLLYILTQRVFFSLSLNNSNGFIIHKKQIVAFRIALHECFFYGSFGQHCID